jgi:hypothetical protein
MPLKVLKRALVLFLALTGGSAAAISALVWYHTRIANPCPTDALHNGEPITCFYKIQPTSDWLSALGALAIGFVVCLLVSWLSLKPGKPS